MSTQVDSTVTIASLSKGGSERHGGKLGQKDIAATVVTKKETVF